MPISWFFTNILETSWLYFTLMCGTSFDVATYPNNATETYANNCDPTGGAVLLPSEEDFVVDGNDVDDEDDPITSLLMNMFSHRCNIRNGLSSNINGIKYQHGTTNGINDMIRS